MRALAVFLPEEAVARAGVPGGPALREGAGQVLAPRPADVGDVAGPGFHQVLVGLLGGFGAAAGDDARGFVALAPDGDGVEPGVHGLCERQRAVLRDAAFG